MRVLVVGPSPSRSKGGMATVIRGIENDERLNGDADIDIFESYIDGNKLTVAFFSVAAYIRFLLFKRNYDVYHIHAASYGSTFRKGLYVNAAKRWKKKVIFHIHSGEYAEFYERLSDRGKRKVREILHKADMVIALSQAWKDKFDDMFQLSNCVVLENGIDINALSPAICDSEEHRKEFAVLGRLGKRKGTYDLIEAIGIAAQKDPGIVCYLAGDGEIDKARETIKRMHLEQNFRVLGWISDRQKIEVLSKVSTVLLPAYHEGLPMFILEGMACGKAVISTRVGAIPEIVHEENGVLVEPGDVQGLADAILQFCGNPSRLSEYGRANIQTVKEKYSMELMHDKLASFYKEVAQGKG